MSLSLQQKNIVNPFAEDLIGGNFLQNKRNKFIQDVIHEAHTNLLLPVSSGQRLLLSEEEVTSLLGAEYTDRNVIIEHDDLVAYTALYPQNCTVVQEQATNGTTRLEALGQAESTIKLKELTTRLDAMGILELYSTNSAPTATVDGALTTGPATAHLRLIAISPNHSNEYLMLIRKSVGSDMPANSTVAEETVMSSIVNSYISSDNNIDIYDWRKNCHPDTDTDKVYYNPIDEKFYFTKRTISSDPADYDSRILMYRRRAWEAETSEDAPPDPGPAPVPRLDLDDPRQAMEDHDRAVRQWLIRDQEYQEYRAIHPPPSDPVKKAVRNGISEILKLSGRYSQNNLNNLLEGSDTPSRKYEFVSHLDLRPGSRWIYVVKVPKSYIDDLTEENNIVLSHDDFELTALQRAKLLLNRNLNKTTLRKVFEVEDLIRFLPAVSRLIKDYSDIIYDEDIPPKVLGGIVMEDESLKVSSFLDYLSICFIYNKRVLDDRNVVEFSFSDKYNLEFMTVDGFMLSRGVGNKRFYTLPETEEEVPAKILNAFSQSTPTTFSIIARCAEIFNEERIKEPSDRKSWVSFMVDNLYPKIDDSAISIRKAASKSAAARRRARRGKVFTKISSLAKEGEDIRNELERASGVDAGNNNYRHVYRVASMMGGLDCNTAQATALRSALKLWQAFSGKTRWRSVVRVAILTLRDEIIKDSVLKAYATKAIQADDNPELVIREIERAINDQIFCGLDVMGNIIETSFLDPKLMDPTKKTGKPIPMGESLKIELKLPRGMGAMGKKSDVYEKMIKEIIMGFIKSLVAGIVKDVLKAALGCGPEGKGSDSLKAAIKSMNYGYVDINSYLDDVDIVAVAVETGVMQNTHQIVDGEEVVSSEPPTPEQLKKLLTDISYMSTPSELDNLLMGDGELLLYSLLLETLSDGTISYPFKRVDTGRGNKKTINRTIDPSVYRNLDLTKEKLQEFLLALGDAMNEENAGEIAQFTFTPMEAYCDTKDPFGLDDFGLGISMEQIESQYDLIAGDKIKKINAMCDWLKELEEIKRKLQELIDNLPIMEYYESMLKLIADISNGLTEALTKLWDSLWGEEAKDVTDPIFNLYVTSFGQDLFNSLHLMLHKRLIAEAKSTVSVLSSQPVADAETEAEIQEMFESCRLPVQTFTRLRPDPSRPDRTWPDVFEELVQAREVVPGQEDMSVIPDSFIYVSPSDIPSVRAPALPMPYPISITTDPWYWWPTDHEGNSRERRAMYALRAGPKDIRQRLTTVPKPADDAESVEEYYSNLAQGYSEALKDRKRVTGHDPKLRNYASRATCQLHIENMSSGSISITTEIQAPDGEFTLVPLATYTPSSIDLPLPTLMEFESEEYFSMMLSSIGPRDTGGSLSPDFLSNRIGDVYSVMPPRNSPDVVQLLNSIFSKTYSEAEAVYFPRNISTTMISNPSERIEKNLDVAFATDLGRSRLQAYTREINKKPFKTNKDKCVTQEDIYIASSMTMVLQSRIQEYFLNVFPVTRVYPLWGSTGTTKLVVEYLKNKIITELEHNGLINQIYDNLDIYKKVYIDNPENEIFRTPENPEYLNIDMTASPKLILTAIIEKIYLSILQNLTTISAYSAIANSPLDDNTEMYGGLETYKEAIAQMFLYMKSEITNAPQGHTVLGLNQMSAEGIAIVNNPGRRPNLNFGDIFAEVRRLSLPPQGNAANGTAFLSNLLTEVADWFIQYRQYKRFLATNPDIPEPPVEPINPGPFLYSPFGGPRDQQLARHNELVQQYESDLAAWQEVVARNGMTREMYASLRTIENHLLDDRDQVTELGLLVGLYYLPVPFLYALHLISYDHNVNLTTNFKSGRMRMLIEKYGADDTFLSSVKGIAVTKYSKNLEGMPVTIAAKRINQSALAEYRQFVRNKAAAFRELVDDLDLVMHERDAKRVAELILNYPGDHRRTENYLKFSLGTIVYLTVWPTVRWFLKTWTEGKYGAPGNQFSYDTWTMTYYDRLEIKDRIETLSIETATEGRFNDFLVFMKNRLRENIRTWSGDRTLHHSLMSRLMDRWRDDGERVPRKHIAYELAHDFLYSIIEGDLPSVSSVWPSNEIFLRATEDNPIDTGILISHYDAFVSSADFINKTNPDNIAHSTDAYRALSQSERVADLLSWSLSKLLDELMVDRESKLAEKNDLEGLLTI